MNASCFFFWLFKKKMVFKITNSHLSTARSTRIIFWPFLSNKFHKEGEEIFHYFSWVCISTQPNQINISVNRRQALAQFFIGRLLPRPA